MARPANSSEDGTKRDHEIKVHLTEAEYEDAVYMSRALNMSKSELFRHLLNLQAYGMLGARFSPSVDTNGSPTIVPLRA